MAQINTFNTPNALEQKLGFKMDCPRCRAWDLRFNSDKITVNINCRQCGLELSVGTNSLVNYSGNILSSDL